MQNIRVIVLLYIQLAFCNSLDSILTSNDLSDGENGRIQSVQLPPDIGSGLKLAALLRSRRNTPELMVTEPFESLLKDNRHSHPRQIAVVYYDQNSSVVIYFDQLLIQTLSSTRNFSSQAIWFSENPHWIFNFTSDVWRYMTNTYGNFGPDPLLYLVVHHESNSKGLYREYSLRTTSTKRRINLLDITCTAKGFHTNDSKNEMMTKLINGLSWFVQKSSKQRFGSPSENIWRINDTYTPFIDIFTYDVYKSLNMSQEAEEYRTNCLGKYDKGPRLHTFWLRDWFFPIYDKYDGNVVLNDYFELLKEFIPPLEYNMYKMSLGEFVHFWSGAAKENLQAMADKAFAWGEIFKKEFQMARNKFPNITEMYTYTNSIKTSQTQEEPNSQAKYENTNPGTTTSTTTTRRPAGHGMSWFDALEDNTEHKNNYNHGNNIGTEGEDINHSGTCKCTPNFTKTKSQRCAVPFNSACDFTSNCTDGLICRNLKCVCPYNIQRYDPVKATCVSKIGGPCDLIPNTALTCGENAFCKAINSTLKNNLGQKKAGHCVCQNGLVDTEEGNCETGHGGTCRVTSDCDSIAQLDCIDQKCACPDFEEYNASERKCVGLVGAKCNSGLENGCTENAQCAPPGYLTKQLPGTCTCNNGFEENERYTCEPVASVIVADDY